MKKKTKKILNEIVKILKNTYPDAKAELDYTNPFELMVAVVLSAQCTDIRVNLVTKELFKDVKSPEDMAQMPIEDLEERIRTCGLFKTKAKNLQSACKIIVKDFGGNVPEKFEDLTSLPGVGRKSANVIMSNAFGTPAIAVDTHVFRVSNRIGLAKADNVTDTENQLMKVIPREDWTFMHHVLIFHGRRTCIARSPKCDICTVAEYCDFVVKSGKK